MDYEWIMKEKSIEKFNNKLQKKCMQREYCGLLQGVLN